MPDSHNKHINVEQTSKCSPEFSVQYIERLSRGKSKLMFLIPERHAVVPFTLRISWIEGFFGKMLTQIRLHGIHAYLFSKSRLVHARGSIWRIKCGCPGLSSIVLPRTSECAPRWIPNRCRTGMGPERIVTSAQLEWEEMAVSSEYARIRNRIINWGVNLVACKITFHFVFIFLHHRSSYSFLFRGIV